MSLLKAINAPRLAHSATVLWTRSFQTSPATSLYPTLQHRQRPLTDSQGIGTRHIASMTFESSKIIPDVVDQVKKTNIKMDVKYKYDHVENGVQISPAHAHSKPSVHLNGTEDKKLYALIMSDPDPPDPAKPVFREWLHWCTSNIPGAGASADTAKGTEITPYMGPAPPIGTHRYVFLLFEQPNQEPLQISDPSAGENGRKNFKTREFAKKYGMGDPVAATYFLSHK